MKRLPLRIFLIAQLIIVPLFITGIFADPPGPPGPGPSPVGPGPPVGAPIDDGICILLALGIAYGCYKIYEIWKKKAAAKEKETI
ncbi:MAG: hypothetical protein ABSE72_01165 [Bacteroidales bacterium]|jgi:hypothetical protein